MGHKTTLGRYVKASLWLFLALTLIHVYVPQASSRPHTTITIDGDDGDWVNIAPIAEDPIGDEEANYDLSKCYVTNDGSNLYFMIKVPGEIQYGSEPPPYAVGLDVDQNPATGETEWPSGEPLDIGIDYVMVGPIHAFWMDWAYNRHYYFFAIFDSTNEDWSKPPDFYFHSYNSSFSNGVLEFSCPLSAIGYPDAIDMIFVGKPFGTDFAPDQTPDPSDYVTYDVAPPLIEADGSVDDWVGVSPLTETTDPEGDAPRGKDEDIVHCYVTNDMETLYVRIDVKGKVSDTEFQIMLDTDVNPATGWNRGWELSIGADYYIDASPTAYPDVYLYSSPTSGVEFPNNTISSEKAGGTIEFAIPLGWIDNPDRIDIVFIASKISHSDITDPLRYEVHGPPHPPPSTPPPYVGGIFKLPNKPAILAPYLALAGLTVAIAFAIKRKRDG